MAGIYTLNQMRASHASQYGPHWEKSSDGEVICFYVRRVQESKSGKWQTINAPDVAEYFGVKAPRSCPKTSSEIDDKVKESADSFFRGLWGREDAYPSPYYYSGFGGNHVFDGVAMSVLLFGISVALMAKLKKVFR